MKKYVKRFWICFASIWVLGAVFFYGTAHWGLLGEMPSVEKLENPKFYLASEIYSQDGKLIGTYFTENRIYVEYEELPKHLVNALVATEDKRYFEHSGIDAHGLGRAIAGSFLGGRGGASTITQQLSKMMFTKRSSGNIFKRIVQKFKEWVMAVELERLYTKEEIITMYFNQFDFLHSSVGVYNASRVYFNKKPEDLTIPEAASLVAMFKSPTIYNPLKKDNSKALARRNTILNLMAAQGFVNQTDLEELKKSKLKTNNQEMESAIAFGSYFKENVRIFMNKWCANNGYNLYKDGLKIYTTLDSRMQKNAEYAVKHHIKGNLQPAFEREWRRRKNGPFYFEGTAAEQKRALKEVLFRGMRQSKRYQRAYQQQKEIIEAYKAYTSIKTEMTPKEKQLETVEIKLGELLFDQKHLKKKDSLKYFEKERLESLDDLIEDARDEEVELIGDIDELRDEYKEKRAEYLKIWKPFDDKMKKVFSKKVEMKIFTWKGTKKVTMSPLDSILHHKKYLRAGLCSIDPTNGHIKAWVGGVNHKHFKYDHVKAKRQAGSSFKPFVYATALNTGMDPTSTIVNKEITFKKGEYGIPKDWTPKNSGSKELEYEFITLKTGLAKSINWVAAQLIKDRLYEVIKTAKNFGISGKIEPVPSICLGITDVSLKEMVSAYTAFANKGYRFEPTFILRIEDKNGKVLYQHNYTGNKVLHEQTAKGMLELMYGNTESFMDGQHKIQGTGYRLRRGLPYGNIPKHVKIAGKTATTQNNSDGWYMGICDGLVTGVWVGCEDRSAHFRSGALGQGANMALPIWGYYMKRNLKK